MSIKAVETSQIIDLTQEFIARLYNREQECRALVARHQKSGLIPPDANIEDVVESTLIQAFEAELPLAVKVKVLDPEVLRFGLPKYAKPGDAGADLHIVLAPQHREEGFTIWEGERALLPTGIALQLPPHHWCEITHRSSTEFKRRLRIVSGTIDTGFIGQLFIHAHNNSNHPKVIQHGVRVGQLILKRRYNRPFVAVEELDATERGENGFGST